MLAASAAELRPDASPGERATLRLGASSTAMEFEVALWRTTDGGNVVLGLLAGGETLERETYEAGTGAFRVVAAGDDAFAPPLDLLRYPVREGAAWGWDGKVTYAGASRDAHAQVTVGRDGDEVRSDVDLSVSIQGTSKERKRKLSFWFRKGHGVVRRAFGEVSSRRPVGEAWRP